MTQPMVLFSDLCARYAVTPTRQGEAWVACPNCGAAARERKFSFSERGGHCFRCGYNTSLSQLAGVEPRSFTPREVPIKPIAPPPDWTGLARKAAARADAVAAWQAYKPLSAETIRSAGLGLGRLPASHCHHERLIVPLVESGKVVGMRGRRIACDHDKWLSPAGARMVLYNASSIVTGDVLVIVENPIDALLVTERWGYPAVATLGVTIWTDTYTEILKIKRPSHVLVCFDNDVPGQTTNPAIVAAWKAARRAKGLPDDETKFLSGIRLTNRLLAAGLPAELWRWPDSAPEGADIGSLFV